MKETNPEEMNEKNLEEQLWAIIKEIEEELIMDEAVETMLSREFWINILEKADKKRSAAIATQIMDVLPDGEPTINVLSALYQVTAVVVMGMIKKGEEHGYKSRRGSENDS
ncbi:MAG: hypothetical protein ACP5KE_06650 [Candidatus Methanodesulfokora sp.]|jgi:hypothetical protein